MTVQRHRTVDEAYQQGREEGFDRGYDEGFAAARNEAKDLRLPAARERAGMSDRSSPPLSEKRALELGFLGLLAYGAWRLLRTWPGRIMAAGSLLVFSGLVSLGLAVLAVIVVAVVLLWAANTLERAAADTRRGVGNLRQLVRALRRRVLRQL